MKNEKKRIFTSLVINYIVFVLILIFLIVITIIFSAFLINKYFVFSPNETLSPKAESVFHLIMFKAGLFFLLLFVISIILFSLWTSKKINRPVRKITEAMDTMVKGNYDVRIEFNAEKEFAIIRDTFNYMAEKLKNAEREKKELEQKKIRMLVDLSHDIKTPITTIVGFSKALSEGLIEDEDKKHRYYTTIFNKASKVGELTNNLFELVKLESVDYKPNLTNNDYIEFIRKILAEHYEEIEEKLFELDLRFPEGEIFLQFDTGLMTRAISNIIGNALKHNPKGTKLSIKIRETDNDVILNIADNGIGIPDYISTKIFDAFVKGDESRKGCHGSGLGLAIAKMIVEKHGGEILLKKGVGEKKTIFSIVLKKDKYLIRQ